MTAPRMLPNWLQNALCAQVDPDLFYPDDGKSARPAKRICAVCPIRLQCLRWAVQTHTDNGVYGGMTPRERRGLTVADVDRMPPVVVPGPTRVPIRVVPAVRPAPAYSVALPAPPPEPVKRQRNAVAPCGTNTGYQRHIRNKEEACGPCKQAARDQRRKNRGTPGTAHLEYATPPRRPVDRWQPVSPGTAVALLGQGDPVYARTVTDWAPITKVAP